MFKKISLVLASLLITSSLVYADEKIQQETKLPIGVVDYQKVIQESLAAKNIKEQLDKKASEFQNEINKQESDLNKKQQELSAQKNVLSEKAFKQKSEEFKGKVNDLQRSFQIKKAQLDQAGSKALAELEKNIVEVVRVIAESKKLDMVLPRQQIIIYNTDLDVTSDVMKNLDQKLPKIEAKIEKITKLPEEEDAAN